MVPPLSESFKKIGESQFYSIFSTSHHTFKFRTAEWSSLNRSEQQTCLWRWKFKVFSRITAACIADISMESFGETVSRLFLPVLSEDGNRPRSPKRRFPKIHFNHTLDKAPSGTRSNKKADHTNIKEEFFLC